MVMVSSCVPAFMFMLAFTLALLWCLVATTHRSMVRTEGRFYCFSSVSRYIRTKLHPMRPGIQHVCLPGHHTGNLPGGSHGAGCAVLPAQFGAALRYLPGAVCGGR